MTINVKCKLVAHKGGFALFRLFEVVSGSFKFLSGCSATFQASLGCCGSLRVVSFFLSDGFKEYFDLYIY